MRGSGDTRVVEILSQQKARDDLVVRLEEAYDLELFQQALTAVQSKVATHNWQAFVQNVLEGRSVAETAQMLGLHEGMVYVARCKIQKMLKREIECLETMAHAEESTSNDARWVSAAQRSYVVTLTSPLKGSRATRLRSTSQDARAVRACSQKQKQTVTAHDGVSSGRTIVSAGTPPKARRSCCSAMNQSSLIRFSCRSGALRSLASSAVAGQESFTRRAAQARQAGRAQDALGGSTRLERGHCSPAC